MNVRVDRLVMTSFEMAFAAQFSNPTAIFFNGLGDHVLVLPTVRALAQIFAKRLTLICHTGAFERFFSDVEFRRVIETEFFSLKGENQFDSIAVSKAAGGADLFLSLAPWHAASTTRLLNQLKPRVSIGLCPGVSRVLTLNDPAMHSADRMFEIARCFSSSIRLEDFAQSPRLSDRVGQRADCLLTSIRQGRRILVVHNETAEDKMWPQENLREFLEGFLDQHRNFVAVILSRDNCDTEIGLTNRGRVISVSGLSLDVVFALVAKADLFVGVDSCLLHVADFNRVPGVGLFGPTSSDRWGFRLIANPHVCGRSGMESINARDVLVAASHVAELSAASA